MEKILSKVIKLKYKQNYIYASIYWLEDEHEIFRITIFEDNRTWSGKYCKGTSFQYTNNTQKDEKDYIQQLKTGFLFNNDMFVFTFAKLNDGTAKFTWKKHLEGTTTILIHGSVHLGRDRDPISKTTLLELMLNENVLLKEHVGRLNSAYEKIHDELSKYKKELEQFVKMKQTVETTLYGKFVQLLNSRRKRADYERSPERMKYFDRAKSVININ